MLKDLIRTANDNNTAIYAIDPRGFGPQRFASLLEGVAADTGGQYFRIERSHAGAAAGRDAVERLLPAWLFRLRKRQSTASFHKMRVKVKPPGLEVRARVRILGAKRRRAERARSRRPKPKFRPRSAARSAICRSPPRAAPSISGWAPRSRRTPNGAPGVAAAPRVGGRPASEPHRSPSSPSTGQTKVFEGPMEREGPPFEAPPGPLKITVTVLDSAGETIDRDVGPSTCPTRGGRLLDQRPGLFPDADRARVAQSRPGPVGGARIPAASSCGPTGCTSGSRSRAPRLRRRP